jgi:hypothetical protein
LGSVDFTINLLIIKFEKNTVLQGTLIGTPKKEAATLPANLRTEKNLSLRLLTIPALINGRGSPEGSFDYEFDCFEAFALFGIIAITYANQTPVILSDEAFGSRLTWLQFFTHQHQNFSPAKAPLIRLNGAVYGVTWRSIMLIREQSNLFHKSLRQFFDLEALSMPRQPPQTPKLLNQVRTTIRLRVMSCR